MSSLKKKKPFFDSIVGTSKVNGLLWNNVENVTNFPLLMHKNKGNILSFYVTIDLEKGAYQMFSWDKTFSKKRHGCKWTW